MTASRSKGFTLIEALVAVLVLSIGLLGVAAMQLKALQSAHVSYQRTVATLAAQDAVERLWVNLGEKTVQDCPAASLTDWSSAWSTHLSLRDIIPIVGSTSGSEYRCEYDIVVGWSDARFADESQADATEQGLSTLFYRIKLPKNTQL